MASNGQQYPLPCCAHFRYQKKLHQPNYIITFQCFRPFYAFLMPLCLFNALRTHRWPAGPCFVKTCFTWNTMVRKPQKQEIFKSDIYLIAVFPENLQLQTPGSKVSRGWVKWQWSQSYKWVGEMTEVGVLKEGWSGDRGGGFSKK